MSHLLAGDRDGHLGQDRPGRLPSCSFCLCFPRASGYPWSAWGLCNSVGLAWAPPIRPPELLCPTLQCVTVYTQAQTGTHSPPRSHLASQTALQKPDAPTPSRRDWE